MTRATPLAQMNTGVNIDGPAGTGRAVLTYTAGVNRWMVSPGNATAETGGNVRIRFSDF